MQSDFRYLLKPSYSDGRALVIGINNYAHASPLDFAVNDAQQVARELIERFGFSADKVFSLCDAEATRDNILKTFFQLTNEDAQLDERVIVFFAGHGCTRVGMRGEIGYLVPFDGRPDDLASLIRWDDLTKNAELIKAKHVFFLMDACYGGLALTRSSKAGSARFLKDMLLRPARQVLTAGKADEPVADSGGPIPGHSVFTGHVLEGMRGKATTPDGVLTANSLMAYVYGKVASDRNSRQTPHYGYLDGDGDLIFSAPNLSDLEGPETRDVDRMLMIPYPEESAPVASLAAKVRRVKELLGAPERSILLHDFVTDEVRSFLSATGDDNFSLQVSVDNDGLRERLTAYEDKTRDIAVIAGCIAYWGSLQQRAVLRKIFSRSTDRLEQRGGVVLLINLRWYPLVIQTYSAGISAVSASNYGALAEVFGTTTPKPSGDSGSTTLVDSVSSAILEFNRADVFKRLPGYERRYTPMSEHLHKSLQPELDDALFLGRSYEDHFDEFEILFALAAADHRLRSGTSMWGPVGRFGWKYSSGESPVFKELVARVTSEGDESPILKSGLFGKSSERFKSVADQFEDVLKRLPWY